MVSEGEKTTETNILSKQNKVKNPNWPVLPSGRDWNSVPLNWKSKSCTIGVYVDRYILMTSF